MPIAADRNCGTLGKNQKTKKKLTNKSHKIFWEISLDVLSAQVEIEADINWPVEISDLRATDTIDHIEMVGRMANRQNWRSLKGQKDCTAEACKHNGKIQNEDVHKVLFIIIDQICIFMNKKKSVGNL